MTDHVGIPAEHPAQARRLVRAALSKERARADMIQTAELLTSELVTNAIVHGSGAAVLVIDVIERRLRVEVHDSESTLDLEPQRVGPSSFRGRGLAIVDALASSWGVLPVAPGKAVWFELVI